MSASINLPSHHKVQKFSSGTGSPGWCQKKSRKTVVVWCGGGVTRPVSSYEQPTSIYSDTQKTAAFACVSKVPNISRGSVATR